MDPAATMRTAHERVSAGDVDGLAALVAEHRGIADMLSLMQQLGAVSS